MILKKSLTLLLFTLCAACNSSTVDDIESAIDIADGVPRKDIDRSQLAANAFANESVFGSPRAQYRELRQTLGINRVRILFAWNDQVQPSPSTSPDFSFYDSILNGLLPDMKAVVVLTNAPSWISDPANWRGGSPRTTFAQRWVRAVVRRYGADPRIEGFQIWNEPNNPDFGENARVGVLDSPAAYVEMLNASYSEVKQGPGGKLVINAATTAINQNYPDTFRYNQQMVEAGMLDFTDAYAIHYYGSSYENVVRSGGIADFLNSIAKQVWVTESGERGVNNQLEYAERTWPFLKDNLTGLSRVYLYQFTESTPADVTYGLRNPDQSAPVSDLYIYLRDAQ